VNFVASTLMKGARASFASRRLISVLPTPVGPIHRQVAVGVDADVGGDRHGAAGDVLGVGRSVSISPRAAASA
jgi:hypothetical protein